MPTRREVLMLGSILVLGGASEVLAQTASTPKLPQGEKNRQNALRRFEVELADRNIPSSTLLTVRYKLQEDNKPWRKIGSFGEYALEFRVHSSSWDLRAAKPAEGKVAPMRTLIALFEWTERLPKSAVLTSEKWWYDANCPVFDEGGSRSYLVPRANSGIGRMSFDEKEALFRAKVGGWGPNWKVHQRELTIKAILV